MKNIILLLLFCSISSGLLAQNPVKNDSTLTKNNAEIIIPDDIDSRNLIKELEGVTELNDGFLLDNKILAPRQMQLISPLTLHEMLPVYSVSNQNSPIYFRKETIYDKVDTHTVFGRDYSMHSLYGSSGLNQYHSPTSLQSATFRLSNGLKLTTYGQYNADGYKVFDPGVLPWQRNNFKGAFEMKSDNGKFGIRIEVNQGRETPFGY
ncbi:MAG: hypothetical protein ACTTKN_06960 [Phocaeicola sp.]|uniref:hypothetical protein n=1 Tax=Phocaeicola TaxID=909656 RepID=UPI00234F87E0|nr:hypothetical protein [Phocaeicola oris]MCE2615470.1 hypothetical protein [Phocaeicola oris]